MDKHSRAYVLCAWFTAGLNTPDLMEALELLKQLS
jgi:hypothetical protein